MQREHFYLLEQSSPKLKAEWRNEDDNLEINFLGWGSVNNPGSGKEHFGILITMIMKWVSQILVFTSSFKAEFEKALSPAYMLVKIAKLVQVTRIS